MSSSPSRREPEPLVDLSAARRCHVVGVGGPGMSAIAKLLAGMGHRVSGSDIRDSAVTEELRTLGVEVTIGHDASLVHDKDVVTYSTAIPRTNVELIEAERCGVAVRHRSGMLASLCAVTRSVGVAGTHGKTTTSALLTLMLERAGLDPSSIVGAGIPGHGVGARAGSSGLLVLEADESDGTLDVLTFDVLVVTNIDVDHLDYFGSFDNVRRCFADAAARTRGTVVLNADDPPSANLIAAMAGSGRLVTFGTAMGSDVRVIDERAVDAGTEMTVEVDGRRTTFVTALRGHHNVMNFVGALAVARALGVSASDAISAGASFIGVERRFTDRGDYNGAQLIDDYAHLPAEISAALSAARTLPGLDGSVIAVFQPNRFHRIAAMADSYADCFGDADSVVITDVYASGTERIEGVTGMLVVDAVRRAHPESQVIWAQTRDDLVAAVRGIISPGDVCVSMGCGDIETFPDDLRRGPG